MSLRWRRAGCCEGQPLALSCWPLALRFWPRVPSAFSHFAWHINFWRCKHLWPPVKFQNDVRLRFRARPGFAKAYAQGVSYHLCVVVRRSHTLFFNQEAARAQQNRECKSRMGGDCPVLRRRREAGKRARAETGEERRRVAAAAGPHRLRYYPALRYGDGLHRALLERARQGAVPLHLLRYGAVYLEHEIRLGHGMAELLDSGGGGEYRHGRRQDFRHDKNVSFVQALRCPPGARVSRRTSSDRPALLHELGGAAVREIRVTQDL